MTGVDVYLFLETYNDPDSTFGEVVAAGIGTGVGVVLPAGGYGTLFKNAWKRWWGRAADKAVEAAKGAGGGPRFVADDVGNVVDTHATPRGSYDQPGGGRTDILQREDHGAGHSHTHDPILNTNPAGETFINGLQQPGRPVSAEDVANIRSGAATGRDYEPAKGAVMGSLNKDQLGTLPWCDVELRGMSWIGGGRDLLLEFRPPSPELGRSEQPHQTICARWVAGLRIDLHIAEGAGGYPLTWDVVFEEGRSGGWSVRLDFGSVGSVSFRCRELELVEEIP